MDEYHWVALTSDHRQAKATSSSESENLTSGRIHLRLLLVTVSAGAGAGESGCGPGSQELGFVLLAPPAGPDQQPPVHVDIAMPHRSLRPWGQRRRSTAARSRIVRCAVPPCEGRRYLWKRSGWTSRTGVRHAAHTARTLVDRKEGTWRSHRLRPCSATAALSVPR